jgi:hypothetical protein
MQIAQSLRGSKEAVMCCREAAGRVGDRASALVPALQELERAVSGSPQGVELPTVRSLSVTLVLLAKVCSSAESARILQRAVTFFALV